MKTGTDFRVLALTRRVIDSYSSIQYSYMSSSATNEENPYAVSSNFPMGTSPNADYRNAIYQSNGLLVMHKQAVLPNRCIKSNEPTEERLKRSLNWHHPAFYLLILFNLIVYAIVALIIRKSAVIQIPLSATFKKRRIRNMMIAWLSVLSGIVCLVLGLALADSRTTQTPAVFLIILFPVLLLFGALFGLFGCRVISAKKIDEHFVWMRGVSPAFRDSFPEWPF